MTSCFAALIIDRNSISRANTQKVTNAAFEWLFVLDLLLLSVKVLVCHFAEAAGIELNHQKAAAAATSDDKCRFGYLWQAPPFNYPRWVMLPSVSFFCWDQQLIEENAIGMNESSSSSRYRIWFQIDHCTIRYQCTRTPSFSGRLCFLSWLFDPDLLANK